jgi:aspartate kinase
MKVFKFGGASVSSVEKIKNIGGIIKNYPHEQLVIIISAIGKTTNALEKVAGAFFEERKEDAFRLFEQIKDSHLNTLKYLCTINWQKAENQLKDFFTEIEWLLHDKPVKNYDYYYDQIVCCGELLSTAIISNYLNEIQMQNQWIDVRDLLQTDNNFRDAAVNWTISSNKITNATRQLFSHSNLIITQGFIGATADNESTTLGREGSDYSAAIFANILSAENLTIWKDVEGVMNADPKQFPSAQYISELSYKEVIEMAYYGAQVIHPKTIKPLQNAKIPLHVKCFLNPGSPGTIISNKPVHNLPPIIVVKSHQVLLQLNSKDFSFMEEESVGKLYQLFTLVKIKPNLTQNTAISFLCCLDDNEEKIEKLALAASGFFDVQLQRNLTLLTIRHYNKSIIEELIEKKTILLEQKTKETVQFMY